MSHYAFCGLSRGHLGELVTELAPAQASLILLTQVAPFPNGL
jgi:hypothetical protein